MKKVVNFILLGLCLVEGLFLGLVAAVVAALIWRIWDFSIIVNAVCGLLIGPLTLLVLYLAFKVFIRYYPKTRIPSFRLAKILIIIAFALVYLSSIASYVGFVTPMSMRMYSLASLWPFLALIIFIIINFAGLFAAAVVSFHYNKAILLEKIEVNTRPEVEEKAPVEPEPEPEVEE